MKKSYTYIMMLLTVLAVASCVKEFDNEGSSPAKGTMPIEFTIADDATRTLLDLTDGKTVVWEDGDQVGLYYRYGGSTIAEKACNVPYKYVAATGKFVPVGEPAYWDEGKDADAHRFWVYYPYREDATAYNRIPASVPATQTYDAAAMSNQIVRNSFAGSRSDADTYGSHVEFVSLGQSFAMFRLNITNATDSEVEIQEVKITVSGDKRIASEKLTMTMANIINGAPKIYSESASSSVLTVAVENGTVGAGECIDVRMMILPDDYTDYTFTVTVTSNQGEHPAVTFGGGEIGNGARASKSIILQAPKYKIGQVVGGGVLYKVDGTTGYVLYPYAAKKKWITTMSGTTVGIEKFSNDGREAVAAMKATEAGIENYPAAKYCDDLEGDWYLPSENELNELFDVYTGNDILESDSGRNYFKNTPGSLAPKYLNARKTFDGYILACASEGQILNTGGNDDDGDDAWSSTTASSNKFARYIRFGKYGSLSTNAPTTSKYARCIKRVDLTYIDESVEQTYPAPTAGEEGEYDVYLLIGQSNMAGRGELLEEDKAEIPNVYILNAEGNVVPATNPLNIYSSIRKADNAQLMGPGSSFASTVAEQTGKKILLVVNARGGSSIAEWAKGITTSITVGDAASATSLSFYEEAVTRTKQAMEHGALKGILWHQGCSDQSNTSYMSQLMKLANNLRTDLGGDVPFIAGQLGDWRSSSANFNTNIKSIGQYFTYSDWVSSEGCVRIESDKADKDEPHFNRASQILIGKRYAQKILKMVYETDYTVE